MIDYKKKLKNSQKWSKKVSDKAAKDREKIVGMAKKPMMKKRY